MIRKLLYCGLLLINPNIAQAVECPTPVPCKVLFLTAEEENVLTGPNGIFDIAERGAAVVLGPPVKYFRTKITDAPRGEMPKAPAAPSPVPEPPKKP